jgi:S1-C subfamily serine protease
MSKRSVIAAVLLAGGFIAWTTWSKWSPRAGWDGAGGPWFTNGAVQSAGLGSDETNNIDIYKHARESVVNITSTVLQRNFFLEIYPVKESGSGVIIDKAGRILTNAHVVSGRAPELEVTLSSGKKYRAERIYVDQREDLALIKINPKDDLRPLPLGDSDRLQVGQKVLAIGNPFGLDGTLTTGIVSSLGRDISDENGNTMEKMIQTDAAINPGNSGGPLLDSSGNVIGINTAIYGRQGSIGIGFALPINRAKEMISSYQSGRRYERPALGVTTIYVQGDLAEEMGLPGEGGLLIEEVASGSAAEGAGLRGAQRYVQYGNFQLGIGGDLIVGVDGQRIENKDALTRVLNHKRPGDKVILTIIRRNRKLDVGVTLGEGHGRL